MPSPGYTSAGFNVTFQFPRISPAGSTPSRRGLSYTNNHTVKVHLMGRGHRLFPCLRTYRISDQGVVASDVLGLWSVVGAGEDRVDFVPECGGGAVRAVT